VPQSRALVGGEKLREKIATLSNMSIIGTLAGSAGMNVYALCDASLEPLRARSGYRPRARDPGADIHLHATRREALV
jgi:hypothetical protein